jgi:hypothetical protein
VNPFLSRVFSSFYTVSPLSWSSPAEYVSRPDKMLALFKKWNITSFYDAGCSHRHWIRNNQFAENDIQYLGGDISKGVVAYCNRTWPELNIVEHDLTQDPFPPVDLIFTNDVLIHLNNEHKLSFLQNFLKSSAQYLLMSHNGNYPHVIENKDIVYNVRSEFPWAPVDWHADPWNFLPELDCIRDADENAKWKSTRLCLWSRAQIAEVIKL